MVFFRLCAQKLASPFKTPEYDEPADIMLDNSFVTSPLLTTKLYRPPVTPDLEQRYRLVEYLERNRQRPLTLISAPAGYGKTILASQWLESCNCRCGWVSLDEFDNDLLTFVSYMLAAVRATFPSIKLESQSLFQAPTVPAATVFARYLLNDLNQIKEPFILVLDDIHRIHEPQIFVFLNELINHPTHAMHLVLLGRHDPPLHIASLRAGNQLTEIRAQELRFTAEEAAGLLSSMLDRQIDGAVAADWVRKTEGWVAALRLVALSLRHRGQSDSLQVHIEGDILYLREYLLAEVLSHLPDTHQDWLLKTALLDRFCASLCEAVCRTDSDPVHMSGEAFISWLESENLFLIPLDDKHEWFRFHHLFQGLLQNMLRAYMSHTDIASLLSLASNWFARNNLIDEAMQQALRAGDIQSAVRLVEQHRYHLMNTEQWHNLDRWLNLLPAETSEQNILLMTSQAFLGVTSGNDLRIFSSTREAERMLAILSPNASEYRLAQGEISVLRGLLDFMVGQPGNALAGAQKGLQLLPSEALYIRSGAIGVMMFALQSLGNFRQCVEMVRETLATSSWPSGIRAKLLNYLCLVSLMEGNLETALVSARECLQISEKLQLPETTSFARCQLSTIFYLRNQLTEAEPYLHAQWKDRALSPHSYIAFSIFLLSSIYNIQGRAAEAIQVIDQLSAFMRETNNTFILAITESFRVELALRQGKLAEARHLGIGVNYDMRSPLWFFYISQLTPIKLKLAEGTTENLQEAFAGLDELDRQMRALNRNNVRIDILALQALVCDALGDAPAALEKLSLSLTIGEPGGYIRNFVDLGAPMAELLLRLKGQEASKEYSEYLDQILTAFPKEDRDAEAVEAKASLHGLQPIKVTSTNAEFHMIESLTRREHQVLKLLAMELSTQEIADKLVISPGTLLTHTKNIYRKLEVHKRVEAVQQAIELGLI